MGLFKPDLIRSFAIGFVLGAVVLLGMAGLESGTTISGQVIPSAQAAPSLPDQTR